MKLWQQLLALFVLCVAFGVVPNLAIGAVAALSVIAIDDALAGRR